ncbi:MAG: metallophosphoesterase [Clostridia bacterium]|nr:metallophosphoesterase [Clostridia bacterium]
MDFLRCEPSVCVVGEDYVIVVNTAKNGICLIKAGDKIFYEAKGGIIVSQKAIFKIRIPQNVLDEEKNYEIIFKEEIEKKSYWSEFKEPLSAKFAFRPITKTENINIYHIADVHYHFDLGEKLAGFFKDGPDLFVVNGDIGEVNSDEDFFKVSEFVGRISKGEIPVLFVRGNHDTRGKSAERFTDFYASDGDKTYFYFKVGNIEGVVLDCGEDKPDISAEYDNSANTPDIYRGINKFHEYRSEQTEFLKNLKFARKDSVKIAVCHIVPVMTTYNPGDIFDIERETYSEWNAQLERLGVKMMLCGHLHKAFILQKDDVRNTLPHDYPVVVGSACFFDKNEFWGAAIVLSSDKADVYFTDTQTKICEEYRLNF